MDAKEQKKIKKQQREVVKNVAAKTDAAENKHNEATCAQALDACRVERDAWKEKFMLVNADWENFKKRFEKERVQIIRASQTALLSDLLVVVDDFDRALAEHHEKTPELDAWLKGFVMIRASLIKLLENYGVKEMAEYTTFDPIYHEALVQVDAQDRESGAIIDVLQKGYMFKDQVLRPAKVSVAK